MIVSLHRVRLPAQRKPRLQFAGGFWICRCPLWSVVGVSGTPRGAWYAMHVARAKLDQRTYAEHVASGH